MTTKDIMHHFQQTKPNALPSNVSKSTTDCITSELKAISSASHSQCHGDGKSAGHILRIGHVSRKLQLLQTV